MVIVFCLFLSLFELKLYVPHFFSIMLGLSKYFLDILSACAMEKKHSDKSSEGPIQISNIFILLQDNQTPPL